MKIRNRILTSLILAGFTVCASAQNIAIVNGKPIPKSRVQAFMAMASAQAQAQGQQLPPNFEEQAKDEIINRELLAQEASKRGLDASSEFQQQMEMARQTLLIRSLVDDERKRIAVTDADIKAEYDRYAKLNGGKEYKLRHILVDQEDAAKALIAQIKKGSKFEALAKKESKDTASGANGGDLDWSNPNRFVKEFSDAVVKLEKGKVTDTPVKTQFGYHIIRLDDVREAKLPPLEQIKPQIKMQLEQQALLKFQEDLRKNAKIE